VDNLVPWEDIKNETHATYVGNGWGYRKLTKWIEDTGYTLQEIGDYMGISRERVRQLLEKDSPRIPIAVEQMKKEHIYS
jgi:DNA-binding transcriptional regulator LsrR (DeoR family)